MKKLLGFLFLVLSQQVFSQAEPVPSFVKDSLDNYVNKALQDWQIPGVSVCVVKNGKVVVMKGYGVKEMGGNEKVDENTLFMIGSNSKAFTATSLALLDAEKKLRSEERRVGKECRL